MERCEICILTSVHQPFDTRVFQKQARTLAGAGYRVALIAQHERDEVVEGIRIIALPRPRGRLARVLGGWRVLRLARRQRSAVYHFHDPELLPVGWLLKRLTGGKVIYDVHEDYPKALLDRDWLPSPLRRPLARLFDWFEKWVARRLDYIVTVSESISERFKDTGRVTTISNYPLLDKIGFGAGRQAENNTVIYAGGLTRVRGISEIVSAMAHLAPSRDCKLVLYGWFAPEGYRQTVEGLAGFERVDYRGRVGQEEIWRKLEQASIGIMCVNPIANAINAMPNKIFEYMAAGLPVVASNFPLWKSIIEGNGCGITVDPLAPADIAGAIEYLLDNPAEARRMGDRGRQAAMEKYNWVAEGRRLLELYAGLLPGRCRAPQSDSADEVTR